MKITDIAYTLINGNISTTKAEIKKLNKLELLNLIQEYSLISGLKIEESLIKIKTML